ncbi:hypothetical protein [Thermoactinospora rubra]|uniref:hypothetical protein n=1 Tax=Thermoactinospora rubra TaxID=1088767 RepID=UPI00117E5543|nr:hypothetical protein [Thermoactinospora rubra]
MGELVGINPEGAKKLLAAMKKARDALNGDLLGEPLKYGLRVAQSDATAEAQASPKRYGDYAGILDKWIKDLNRRIEIISNIPPAGLGHDGNKVTATIPLTAEARRQAEADAKELADAWKEYLRERNNPMGTRYTAARQRLLDALKKSGAQVHDPEYAEIYLKHLGADTLKDIVDQFTEFGRPDNPYVTGGNYDYFKEYLGGLSMMVATADRAGTLPKDVRDRLLETQPVNLAVFMRLAPHTPQLLADATKRILSHSGSPVGDLALAQIMHALKANPHAMQLVLADPEAVKKLTSSSITLHDKDYFKNLNEALNNATKPGAGDPAALKAAWAGILKASGDEHWRGDLNSHPELARTLAENFKPYLRWAAHEQAKEFGKTYELNIPGLPKDALTLDGVSLDDVKNFIGAVSTDAQARGILLAEAQRLAASGQSRFMITPERLKSGDLEDPAFQAALAQDQAMLALILGGVQRAKLDGDARRAANTEVLKTLVVGYLTMPFKAYGPVVDVATNPLTSKAAKDLVDWIHDKMGDTETDPEEFYEKFTEAYRAEALAYLKEQAAKLPEGERPSEADLKGMANQLVFQFEAQGGRAMLEEFWKDAKK